MCFFTDIHLTFLMQWVPLYPLMGLYTLGILGSWFDVSPHWSLLIAGCVVIMQLELLVICFMKKHQAISIISRSYALPKYMEYTYNIMCILSIPSGGLYFNSIRMPKDEQWQFIGRIVPQYYNQFQSLPNFDVYEKNSRFYVIFGCFGFLVISITVSLIFLILSIFRMMRKLKIQISAMSFQRHAEAIRSLTVQSATCLFCLAPPVLLSVFVYFEVENSQILTELCIVWIGSHSSINMCGLLIFFDPYRSFILKEFRR
ncbi:hypothetical protein CAEBREN_23457 [Caenorhabditis brenneri]|uniref:Uncharacterized protein n=1 Tax=Caenorhabditis brenneri TaxID=135651 RepID=G0NJF7_CAEBE|nr:hypothetical protein CAEBREN_23457 [Caenorhabditis brenneri]